MWWSRFPKLSTLSPDAWQNITGWYKKILLNMCYQYWWGQGWEAIAGHTPSSLFQTDFFKGSIFQAINVAWNSVWRKEEMKRFSSTSLHSCLEIQMCISCCSDNSIRYLVKISLQTGGHFIQKSKTVQTRDGHKDGKICRISFTHSICTAAVTQAIVFDHLQTNKSLFTLHLSQL